MSGVESTEAGKQGSTSAKGGKPTKAELARAGKEDTEEPKPGKKGKSEKKNPAKEEPARIWVQVAGGSNAKALPGTWKNLVKKSPAAFKGRTAYTAPLHATHRLLTGPFESDDEAQEFVNKLRKQGISSFQFNSDTGQKVARLDGKKTVSESDTDEPETAKKGKGRKGSAKEASAEKESGKKGHAKKGSAKKESAKKEGGKKGSSKKETAKKGKAKHEAADTKSSHSGSKKKKKS
jgi:hypothetical protein